MAARTCCLTSQMTSSLLNCRHFSVLMSGTETWIITVSEEASEPASEPESAWRWWLAMRAAFFSGLATAGGDAGPADDEGGGGGIGGGGGGLLAADMAER